MAGGICLHISFDFRTVLEIRGVFCGLIEFSLKITPTGEGGQWNASVDRCVQTYRTCLVSS